MSERTERILQPMVEHQAYMDDRVQAGIEANRKGFARLEFVNAQGDAVTDVHVSLEQMSHDFRFGANCFMLDELETAEKNSEYQSRFRELFNLATLPFYWSDLEPEAGKPRFGKDSPRLYRRPVPDLCLEFCEAHGIEPKLHCLNYDQWTPPWVPDDAASVKKLLDRRFADIASRYAGRIPGMEVINETLCPEIERSDHRHSTRFFREPDLVEWSFRQARKYLPANHLIINEATDYIWGDAFRYNRSAYYMQIERALAQGASIDAIGLQFHMFYRAGEEQARTRAHYDPRRLYAVMDQYALFGKPLQITEITIPAYSAAKEDEQLQADIIRNLYSIWFSHPAMEAIIYWNLADGYAAFAPQGDMSFGENYYHGGLLRFDLSEKPAFRQLKQLIHETWHTSLSVKSGAAHRVDVKGFYGTYEVTASTADQTIQTTLHLEKGTDNHFVIII